MGGPAELSSKKGGGGGGGRGPTTYSGAICIAKSSQKEGGGGGGGGGRTPWTHPLKLQLSSVSSTPMQGQLEKISCRKFVGEQLAVLSLISCHKIVDTWRSVAV